MHNQFGAYLIGLLNEISSIDSQIILLVILVVIAVIVLDGISLFARRQHDASGVARKSTTMGIEGSKDLPVKNYVSEIQRLAGRPDALIQEHGYIIPVERKPLARKIRDRYVAQLLVYMRLVEEFEGKKPPYGYLILGSNCRRFKIDNTPARQAWLQKMLDEMQGILKGAAQAEPQPHFRKCGKCDVRESCAHRVDRGACGAKEVASKKAA